LISLAGSAFSVTNRPSYKNAFLQLAYQWMKAYLTYNCFFVTYEAWLYLTSCVNKYNRHWSSEVQRYDPKIGACYGISATWIIGPFLSLLPKNENVLIRSLICVWVCVSCNNF
jgi:hypothetical protein